MHKHRRSRQALLFPQKSRRKYRLDGFHPLVPIEDVDGAIIRFGGRQAVDYGSVSPSVATLIGQVAVWMQRW